MTDFEVPNEDLVGAQEQSNTLADIPLENEYIENALPIELEENETGEISPDIEIMEILKPTADTIPQDNQDGWGDVQQDTIKTKRLSN